MKTGGSGGINKLGQSGTGVVKVVNGTSQVSLLSRITGLFLKREIRFSKMYT